MLRNMRTNIHGSLVVVWEIILLIPGYPYESTKTHTNKNVIVDRFEKKT